MRFREVVIVAVILVILTSTAEGKKKKKKTTGKKPAQELMEMRDLSQMEELSKVLRQAADVTVESSNVTAVSASKQGPCTCGHGVCSCCSKILLNYWKQKACVNVTYDPDEFEFTAKVVMNDRLLYKRTVSGLYLQHFIHFFMSYSIVSHEKFE